MKTKDISLSKKEMVKIQDEAANRQKTAVIFAFMAIILISLRSVDSIGWGVIAGIISLGVAGYAISKVKTIFYLKMRSEYQFGVYLIGLAIAITSLSIPTGDTLLIQDIGEALVVATTILIVLAPSFYEKVGARLLRNKGRWTDKQKGISSSLSVFPMFAAIGALLLSIASLMESGSNFILSTTLINLTLFLTFFALLMVTQLLMEDILRQSRPKDPEATNKWT
ncbi:MAG: hypothetical protein KGH61_05595 [Candidatus Micrarchaeota archaeon]|nr:hypothetical protein [Candidatus Micrarchaeota archaeon]MDE1848388.1 hypothetical protein [Candidatus Micrarchaeota archaeon]MDE1864302.1 hypothetical protein [Candidatus Micrarchaeota archaeon]